MKQPAPFESSGWRVIPGFLDAIEVEIVQASLHSTLAQPRQSCMTRPGNDLVLLRWDEAAVASIHGSQRRIEQLRDRLGAADLKWLSGYISSKGPQSPPLWWHQDWWCWDHPISFRRAAAQVAVLCYLTDTDENNGALRVLSGSHHHSIPLHGHLPTPHSNEAIRRFRARRRRRWPRAAGMQAYCRATRACRFACARSIRATISQASRIAAPGLMLRSIAKHMVRDARLR
jgi:hypothetical protein